MNASISITQTTSLTDSQKSSLLSLAALCCQKDHISLSYPVLPEDNACHYLLADSRGKLLSALAGLPLDSSSMECIAFTHPDHRKRGYFSRLLSLAMKDWEEQDILFPVSGSCPDTMAVLASLNAELEYQEYKMEYVLSGYESFCDSPSSSNHSLLSYPAPCISLVPPSDIFSKNASWSLLLADCAASSDCPLVSDFSTAFGIPAIAGCSAVPAKLADSCCFSALQTPAKAHCHPAPHTPDKTHCHPAPHTPDKTHCHPATHTLAGSCLTSPVSQDTLCIHHVEILPDLRGRGLGFLLMSRLIYCLQKTQIRRLLLHVSGSNVPAVALYKKTGFGITETLSYYMY